MHTSNPLFEIGINLDGAIVNDYQPALTIPQQFAAVRGHFDYVEKSLWPHEVLSPWLRESERCGVPIHVTGSTFQPDHDLQRACSIMRDAVAADISIMNCQILPPSLAKDDASALASVGEFYLELLEAGDKGKCLPTLEIHIDMWSEQFKRIEQLAAWLKQRQAPLYLTIDHSHLLYRLGNADQLQAAGLAEAKNGGWAELHPDSPTAFYRRWMSCGWIAHVHARSVQLNGVENPWCQRESGLAGRGVQYPLIEPPPGTYHQSWSANELEPWKKALRQLIQWKTSNLNSKIRRISCEFIPFADYGGGSRYNLLQQNIACAQWLRSEIDAYSL
ncbi:TPA: hypothetical protein ACJI3N_004066 [Raoultella planticola]